MSKPPKMQALDQRQEAAFNELRDCYVKLIEEKFLSNLEALAMASQMVGMLLAMQDPEQISKADAVRMVQVNVEQGNKNTVMSNAPPSDRMN